MTCFTLELPLDRREERQSARPPGGPTTEPGRSLGKKTNWPPSLGHAVATAASAGEGFELAWRSGPGRIDRAGTSACRALNSLTAMHHFHELLGQLPIASWSRPTPAGHGGRPRSATASSDCV